MVIPALHRLGERIRDPRVAGLLLAPPLVLALSRDTSTAAPGLPFLGVFAILAGALWFGWLAGALEGAYVALLLGPFIGSVRVVPRAVSHEHWWMPAAFFVVLGVAGGAATQHLRRRLSEERRQRSELERLHARSLVVFANLVAHRDQPTAHHCERVARNVRYLGALYGLDEADLDALYWAGMLHDLGKITTPASILLKNGKLTDDEYQVIQRHPGMGADVLLDISPRFQAIAEGVRSHHERWDGSGYPDGMAGESIPLFGRLLAVADVFEAMTAPRPYRGALSPHDVMHHLQERAGKDFDPAIVRLFAQQFRRGQVRTHADGQFLPPPSGRDDLRHPLLDRWAPTVHGPRARRRDLDGGADGPATEPARRPSRLP